MLVTLFYFNYSAIVKEEYQLKLGLFGGSFDPIHYGHLLLAESARDQLNLDRVIFLPLGEPPHHKDIRSLSDDRFNTTVLAIQDYPEFEASRYEIDKKGVSYSVDTLRHYRTLFPNDEVFWIVSSETFNDFPNWRSPAEICRLASLVIARRAGYPEPNFESFTSFCDPKTIEVFKRQVIDFPFLEISSTLLRQRVRKGRSIRFLTPNPVVEYINKHRMYTEQ